MKNKINREIFVWVLAVLPLIAVLLVYNKLPESIPMHWDINGQVSYGAKVQLWLPASLGLILSAMFVILPKIDPRRGNYDKFDNVYFLFRIMMMIFLLGMTLLVISESFYPGHIRVSTVVTVALGILFTFLGNALPKIKNNFFMGIKTPWTLSSVDVWNKTHRLGGFLMFLSGIVMIISAFILPELPLFVLMMALVLLFSIIPTVMSYIWFRQEERKKH